MDSIGKMTQIIFLTDGTAGGQKPLDAPSVLVSRTIANPLERKIGKTRALIMCLLVWAYTVPWAVLPLTETWGRFVPEGYLTTCTFDYLSDDLRNKYFVATLFVFSYIIPVSLIIYFYTRIVGHVIAHERSLREQVSIDFQVRVPQELIPLL